MESLDLKAAIEQWVTVRKNMVTEQGSEALVTEILQKVAEVLMTGVNQGKLIKVLTFDIDSRGRVVLLWEYDDCESRSGRKQWDTLITKYEKGREQIYIKLEQHFKQYADLKVWAKHDTFEENQYIELRVSVKEE